MKGYYHIRGTQNNFELFSNTHPPLWYMLRITQKTLKFIIMLVFNPFLTAIFESQIWYFENIKYFGGREYTAQTFKIFQDYIFSKHYYCRGRCKTPRGTHENIVCIVVDGKMICFGGQGRNWGGRAHSIPYNFSLHLYLFKNNWFVKKLLYFRHNLSSYLLKFEWKKQIYSLFLCSEKL